VCDESQDGKKTNPWGPGVKGQAIWDGTHYSWQQMSADRSKTASDNPRDPVGQAIAHFDTYTVNETDKTLTNPLSAVRFRNGMGLLVRLTLRSLRITI
jgi:hypothetical protein